MFKNNPNFRGSTTNQRFLGSLALAFVTSWVIAIPLTYFMDAAAAMALRIDFPPWSGFELVFFLLFYSFFAMLTLVLAPAQMRRARDHDRFGYTTVLLVVFAPSIAAGLLYLPLAVITTFADYGRIFFPFVMVWVLIGLDGAIVFGICAFLVFAVALLFRPLTSPFLRPPRPSPSLVTAFGSAFALLVVWKIVYVILIGWLASLL